MDLTDLIQGGLGATVLKGAASKLGIENKQAQTAIAVGLPLLMTALKKNSQNKDGAQGILGAINNKHDGGILDSIEGLFGGGHNENEGLKIVDKIFGGNKDSAVNAVSKQSGLSTGKVLSLLAVLAPIVMGIIGKNAKQNNADENSLTGMIGGLLGGLNNSHSNEMGLLDKLLDDNDPTDENSLADIGTKLLGGLFK